MSLKDDAQTQALEADQAIFRALQDHDATVAELTAITGLGERRVRRCLDRLQTAGVVVKSGTVFSLNRIQEQQRSQRIDHPEAGPPPPVDDKMLFGQLLAQWRQGYRDASGCDDPEATMATRFAMANFGIRPDNIPKDVLNEIYLAGYGAGHAHTGEARQTLTALERQAVDLQQEITELKQQAWAAQQETTQIRAEQQQAIEQLDRESAQIQTDHNRWLAGARTRCANMEAQLRQLEKKKKVSKATGDLIASLLETTTKEQIKELADLIRASNLPVAEITALLKQGAGLAKVVAAKTQGIFLESLQARAQADQQQALLEQAVRDKRAELEATAQVLAQVKLAVEQATAAGSAVEAAYKNRGTQGQLVGPGVIGGNTAQPPIDEPPTLEEMSITKRLSAESQALGEVETPGGQREEKKTTGEIPHFDTVIDSIPDQEQEERPAEGGRLLTQREIVERSL